MLYLKNVSIHSKEYCVRFRHLSFKWISWEIWVESFLILITVFLFLLLEFLEILVIFVPYRIHYVYHLSLRATEYVKNNI